MDRADYVIGPADILRVQVWKQPELSVDVPVRPDGKISVPLANDVQAAGLTTTELSDVLTQGARRVRRRAGRHRDGARDPLARTCRSSARCSRPTRDSARDRHARARRDRGRRRIHSLRGQVGHPHPAPESRRHASSSTASTTTRSCAASTPKRICACTRATRSSCRTEDRMRRVDPRHARAALSAAVPAGAAEFIPAGSRRTVWNSNVLRARQTSRTQLRRRTTSRCARDPTCASARSKAISRYDLDYQLRYEAFARLNGISTFDHFANGERGVGDDGPTDGSSASRLLRLQQRASTGIFETVGLSNAIRSCADARADHDQLRGTRTSATASGRSGNSRSSGDNQFYDYGDEISRTRSRRPGRAGHAGASRAGSSRGSAARTAPGSSDDTAEPTRAGHVLSRRSESSNYRVSPDLTIRR